MSVAVVSSVYGLYRRFLPRWWEAVINLEPYPDQIIIATDRHHDYPFDQVVKGCAWEYPQAFYLDTAIRAADTDWVWIIDADDYAIRNGLKGLGNVDADVWQLGFQRSDGELYTPPLLTNEEYLARWSNPYVGASMIRVQAYKDAGGFPDIALQDWGLWRRMAQNGATFLPSDRAHFHFMLHPGSRGHTELGLEVRSEHIGEMIGSEYASVT